MPNNQQKILVELSGGLDSSYAAVLLQKQGFEVIGVMMLLQESSTFEADRKVAEEVSKNIGIDFHVIDFRKEFKCEVIDYFIESYKQAKTPNPCIICNQRMKFGAVFDLAQKFDCDYIATGHYAQIKFENGLYALYHAKDKSKDQSYVLHFLNQDKLSKIIFPLGKYTKDEIRKFANEAGLPCVDKEESMDICFVENKNYPEFILQNSDYIAQPGNVIDTKGNLLGQHEGLINYTIGQRKGLGIAANEPLYVLSLNKEKNEIVLGTKEETLTNEVKVSDFSWIAGKAPAKEFKCQAKLRYRQQPRNCKATVDENNVTLLFPEGIDSVTPGQFAVLYDNKKVLGGGTIN